MNDKTQEPSAYAASENLIDSATKPIKARIAALDERLTTTADHIASQLGGIEARFSQISKDFLESHEGIDKRIDAVNRRFDTLAKSHEGIHAMVDSKFDQFEALIKASIVPAIPSKADLYTALVAAQLEIKNAEATVDNEFTKKKYADLASVMDAVREPLAKNGLAIIQLTEDPGEGMLGIRTLLVHESGQVIEDLITMAPEKFTPQGVGSCRTYMRRYAVLAICGIAGAVDDDAEGATAGPDEYERITAQEAEAVLVKADELFGDRADAALAKMLNRLFNGITRVGDIKAGEAKVAITNLENAAALMAKTAAEKKKVDDKLAKGEKAAKAEADEKGSK